jgi:hypothetical protein
MPSIQAGNEIAFALHDRRGVPRGGPHRHVATLNYPFERGLLVVRAAAGQDEEAAA